MTSLSNRAIAFVSIICSIATTLLTDGWPMSWLTKLVLAPQYNPWRIDFFTLILNLLGLSLGFYVLLYSILKTGEQEK